jgi:Na+/H+ antiporter NhaD/arsenite permease-like protein
MSILSARRTLFATQIGRASHSRPDAVVIIFGVAFLVFYVAFRRGWRPKPRFRLSLRGVRGIRIRPLALLPSVVLLIVLIALLVSHNG